MNNNEERKNTGQGIFYAVIGVATLVVTIIGATFAFFSASASSNNGAVTASGATINLGMNTVTGNLRSALIPMNETNTKFAGVIKEANATKKCVDDNGNNICSVFTFTVTNPATSAQTIFPSFEANVNQFTTTNLRYAVFKGTAEDIGTSANLTSSATATPVSNNYASATGTVVSNGTLIVKNTTVPSSGTPHTGNTDGDTLANMRITLAGGQSITYTIVMWIHETGSEQNADQSKQFAATIRFSTSGGGTGVTGVLSTTS